MGVKGLKWISWRSTGDLNTRDTDHFAGFGGWITEEWHKWQDIIRKILFLVGGSYCLQIQSKTKMFAAGHLIKNHYRCITSGWFYFLPSNQLNCIDYPTSRSPFFSTFRPFKLVVFFRILKRWGQWSNDAFFECKLIAKSCRFSSVLFQILTFISKCNTFLNKGKKKQVFIWSDIQLVRLNILIDKSEEKSRSAEILLFALLWII